MLSIVGFISVFSAAACGVEEQVQQRVEEEVQQQVEEEMQNLQKRVEEKVGKGQ
jgi:hypothetical protein